MKKKISKAVALKYPEGAEAPFVTAKGKGELAEKILRIAGENNIPVKTDAAVVDILSGVEIGQLIPEETWEVLAGIFAFIINSK